MIIIVHGPPAAGKSTLAKMLSDELKIPHISSDSLSEWIFDSIEESNRVTPLYTIRNSGYELMFKLSEELSKGKNSFIMEGCLNPNGAGPRLMKFLKGKEDHIFEIFVSAPSEVLIKRYEERGLSGERHPVCIDYEDGIALFPDHLKKVKYRPLRIGKKTNRVMYNKSTRRKF